MITLRDHLIAARKKVKPENCARSSRKMRAAANVRWANYRARKALEASEKDAPQGSSAAPVADVFHT